MRTATAVCFLSLAGSALASDFSLSLPVDCDLGDTCFIQQYMDRDGGPEAYDFTCGPLSYDGHSGTDFALTTLADMDKGVDVLAAAPGTVLRIRDGMRDAYYSQETAAEIAGRDCGNGVVLDHGNGWTTQYCHLKKGSVRVADGDLVDAGDPLGQIGLSGRTQFPHLHITVRRYGREVDPFGTAGTPSCKMSGAGDQALWDPPIAYVPGGILDIGFSTVVPEYADVKAGTADRAIEKNADAIVVFAYIFGARKGDRLLLSAKGPDGQVFSQTVELDRTQAQLFRAGGTRLRSSLQAGRYTGIAALTRGNQEVDRALISIEID